MTNKLVSTLKTSLYDLANLAGNIGLVGIVDYIGGDGINHPMGDIAIGAGLTAGDAYTNKNTRRMAQSGVALVASMYPQFSDLAQTGEWDRFVLGAGVKVVGYSAGLIFSGLMGEWVKSDYNSIVEVNAVFPTEAEASTAHQFVEGIMKVGEYIRSDESVVDEPQQVDDGYRVHARLVGKEEKMREHLKPSLDQFFGQTVRPLEVLVSDVVKVK